MMSILGARDRARWQEWSASDQSKASSSRRRASAWPRWLMRFLSAASSSPAPWLKHRDRRTPGRSRSPLSPRGACEDASVPAAFGDQRRGIVGGAQQHDRAMEMRAALRIVEAFERAEQLGDVRRRIAVPAGVAGRMKARRAAERIDADAGIVAERRQAATRATAWRALISAFSTNVVPVSSASSMPSSDCAISSMPVSASISRISASLPRLLLATTMRRNEGCKPAIRRWPAPRAASRRVRRRLWSRARAVHRARRGGTRGLRPCPAAR